MRGATRTYEHACVVRGVWCVGCGVEVGSPRGHRWGCRWIHWWGHRRGHRRGHRGHRTMGHWWSRRAQGEVTDGVTVGMRLYARVCVCMRCDRYILPNITILKESVAGPRCTGRIRNLKQLLWREDMSVSDGTNIHTPQNGKGYRLPTLAIRVGSPFLYMFCSALVCLCERMRRMVG